MPFSLPPLPSRPFPPARPAHPAIRAHPAPFAVVVLALAALLAFPSPSARADSERRRLVDPDTGVEIWQITSFPTVHENLYFHSRSWTEDGRTFLFKAYAEPRRGAPRDLYRCDVDGQNLRRLASGEELSNVALHPKLRRCWYLHGLEVRTLDIDAPAVAPGVALPARVKSVPGGIGSMTDDGRLFCFPWLGAGAGGEGGESGRGGFALHDTVAGETRLIELANAGIGMTHLQIEPGRGERVQYVLRDQPAGPEALGPIGVFVADLEGKATRLPFRDANGHDAWLGATGLVYTNTLGAQRDIFAAAPGDATPRVIAKAPPRFWHTGVDPSGEWMVSDTSSPDDGLHLIHAPTGRHRPLCRAGSSQGHSQYTHPHPCVSPGGRHVLFNSDRTGVPHVYVAEIPERFREDLRGGSKPSEPASESAR